MARISKGCEDCRARKVRCDQTRPRCERCARRGKDCQYRDLNDLVFRNDTDHTIHRARRLIAERAALKDVKQEQMHSLTQAHGISTGFYKLDVASPSSVHIPSAIDPGTMMRYQVTSSYCTDYFPCTKLSSDANPTHFVFMGIFALSRKSPMLETACSALAYIFQGRIHCDEYTLQHGVRLYNRAIRHLAYAMSRNPDNVSTEDIVYTTVIFQQIQIHYCPHSLDQWLAHIDGLNAIMRHYSSTLKWKPSSPLLTAVCGEYQKFQVALTGFMHEPDDSITWLKEPLQGGIWSEYLKLLIELSRIGKAVSTTNTSNHTSFKSLLANCLALEKGCTDLWTKMSPEGEPPTYARGELNTGIAPTDDLFGPAYRFYSLDDAILHSILCVGLSFLYPLIRQCRVLSNAKHNFPDRSFLIDDFQDEEHRLSISYVAKAARCLPYCGQKGVNAWSMSYAVWVATQASRVYTHTRDWERFSWAQNSLAYVESLGFGIAGQFRNMWGNYWFETHKHDAYRVMSLRSPVEKYKISLYEKTEERCP